MNVSFRLKGQCEQISVRTFPWRIGPKAHDVLARVRGRDGDVDRNEVRKHDAVLGQASE